MYCKRIRVTAYSSEGDPLTGCNAGGTQSRISSDRITIHPGMEENPCSDHACQKK
jgi:hypothetical protein